MKKAILALIGLMATSPVMASTVTTSGTATPSHTALHSHSVEVNNSDTTRQDFGYGVGADVTVYKSGHPLAEEVRIDTRYDVENRETRVFGVVKVDLFEYLTNR